jgi:predicted O-methyltransferase YrrM
MNSVLEEIYRDGPVIIRPNGEHHARHEGIPPDIAYTLYKLVNEQKLKRTLEVGMAFGMASLAICQALHDNGEGKHVAIDPYLDGYAFAGIANLEKAGLMYLVELQMKPSQLVLPQFVQERRKFDLIFIDGSHLFDSVIVDFFYSQALIPPGGWIAIDDIDIPAVAAAYDFITSNLKNFTVVEQTERLGLLQKTSEDHREWYHFEPFSTPDSYKSGVQYHEEAQRNLALEDEGRYYREFQALKLAEESKQRNTLQE